VADITRHLIRGQQSHAPVQGRAFVNGSTLSAVEIQSLRGIIASRVMNTISKMTGAVNFMCEFVTASFSIGTVVVYDTSEVFWNLYYPLNFFNRRTGLVSIAAINRPLRYKPRI
jgi:hypothetical protein